MNTTSFVDLDFEELNFGRLQFIEVYDLQTIGWVNPLIYKQLLEWVSKQLPHIVNLLNNTKTF